MIVVTAPTGNIGSKVLKNLLAGDEEIRVIARNLSKLPIDSLPHIEVIEGSHGERDVVMRAFEGADSVFWLVSSDPTALSAEASYVDFSRAGCEALRCHGVKHVVGISSIGRGWPRDAGYITATLKADDLIAETGVAYRALAVGSLMENVLRQTALIRESGDILLDGFRRFQSPSSREPGRCGCRGATIAQPIMDGSRKHPAHGSRGHHLWRDGADHVERARQADQLSRDEHRGHEGRHDHAGDFRRHGTGHGQHADRAKRGTQQHELAPHSEQLAHDLSAMVRDSAEAGRPGLTGNAAWYAPDADQRALN